MAEPAKVDIDMTPMIDIVFQLLTFFMVVINFEASDADERVKLAVSAMARPPKVKPADEVIVQVGFNRRRDGTVINGPWLFYLGQEYAPEALEAEVLRREKAFYRLKHPEGKIEAVIVIRADGDVPAGVVQKMIETCQKQQFEKFALKAMQPEGG